MRDALGTAVTLLVNVPTAAADAASLPADQRTAGTVVKLRAEDAQELVAAGLARFGDGGNHGGTMGEHRITVADVLADPRIAGIGVPSSDTDREKYVPGRLSDANLRAAYVAVQDAPPAPQPTTTAGWCTVSQDTSAYSFPARVLPPQTNRKRFVIRNRGTSPVWVGYGTGDESNYNRPADANFTANGIVAVGQEWVEGPSEQAVFVRPTTNGPAVLVSVYVELGA